MKTPKNVYHLWFYVLYLWFTSNRMAAMLDFAKSQKSKPHGIVDLWAKLGVLGRMWPKQSFYCPDYLQICMCNRPRVVVDVQFPMKTVQIVFAYPSVLPS